jgi:hypothetical protein
MKVWTADHGRPSQFHAQNRIVRILVVSNFEKRGAKPSECKFSLEDLKAVFAKLATKKQEPKIAA